MDSTTHPLLEVCLVLLDVGGSAQAELAVQLQLLDTLTEDVFVCGVG